MNNENKSLMSPDRVLSLVVLTLSILMILGSAFLYYTQAEISSTGAMISRASDQAVEQIRMKRQQQAEVSQSDEGGDKNTAK